MYNTWWSFNVLVIFVLFVKEIISDPGSPEEGTPLHTPLPFRLVAGIFVTRNVGSTLHPLVVSSNPIGLFVFFLIRVNIRPLERSPSSYTHTHVTLGFSDSVHARFRRLVTQGYIVLHLGCVLHTKYKKKEKKPVNRAHRPHKP